MIMALSTSFLPRRTREGRREVWPKLSLFQQDLNQIFDEFFSGVSTPVQHDASHFGKFNPKINVIDNPEELVVTAELPGLEEKEIDVSITKDYVTIKGEKKDEFEKKGEKDRYYYERSYGAFERMIPLYADIDENKVEATFKKGVLTLRLPKSAEARGSVKKISVKGA